MEIGEKRGDATVRRKLGKNFLAKSKDTRETRGSVPGPRAEKRSPVEADNALMREMEGRTLRLAQ